jgi:hypothetical protein
MSHDKDELAGAGRLTRAIDVTLSAEVDSPPRLPRILGRLASQEARDALKSQEAWDAFRKQAPPPVTGPDPEEEERAERFVEAVEELGRDEALKAIQRKAPGRPAGKETPQERRDNALYDAAMKAAGGKTSAARRKFIDASELAYETARRNFAAIHKRRK